MPAGHFRNRTRIININVKKPNTNQTATPDPATHPQRDRLRQTAHALRENHPPTLNGSELLLVEVDPHRANAYWTIEPQLNERARAEAGDPQAPLVLRVYDITGIDFDGTHAHQAFDVDVQGLQGRWYIDMWRHDRTFITDLGYLKPDGTLSLIARSNPVHTPPAVDEEVPEDIPAPEQAAMLEDAAEAEVEPGNVTSALDDLLDHADAVIEESPDSEGENDELTPSFPLVDWTTSTPPLDETPPEKAGSVTRTLHEPPAPEGVGLTPLSDVIESYHRHEDSDSPSPGLPTDLHYQSPAGEPRPETGPPSWPSGEELLRHVPPSGEETQTLAYGLAPETSAPEPGSHPPDAPPPSPPPPTPIETLPLSSVVHLSSRDAQSTEVLLEINAELHIYGRAKPNTKLSIYGQEVTTRPDGSFSVRRPLPKGAVVLPLVHTQEAGRESEA